MNCPEVLPSAICAVPGTVICVLPAEIITLAPPAGAAPESVTLQEVAPPPVNVCGVQVNLVTASFVSSGTRFNVAVEIMPVIPAEIVTDLFAFTDVAAVALKVVLVAPAPICNDDGMLSLGSLAERSTLMGDPEACVKVTVHVAEAPATTVAGLQLTDCMDACVVTWSENVTEALFRVAVRMALKSVVTVCAVTVKDALFAPA